MGNVLTRILGQWGALSASKRIAVVVMTFGVIGSIAIWGILGSQVSYDVAFSHVKSADASPVVDKLKELQIPYQVTTELDGTTTIRVPSSMVDEAKVRIAGSGLLQGGGVGYEIFNQPSFGLSDFIQKVDYQRALEGELARSIGQIDGIDTARVHLAIPQPHVFVSQQQDPSAAVILALKPGRRIDKAQSAAIVGLVVGAVEGMKPAQVVLLDTQGRLLHQADDATSLASGAVGDQYATQRTMEQDAESRLQEILDRVVGPGHASTQVSMSLDWSQGDITSETFLPNGQQAVIKTSQDILDSQHGGVSAGGIPGVTSNVPTYQQTGTTPTPGGTPTPLPAGQHIESNRTYEVSKTTETTKRTPGIVKRLSVAIAVDKAVANQATLDSLTQMTQAAVGYDAKRGDTVTVVAVDMKPAVNATPIDPSVTRAQPLELARIAALAAGPSLAIIVLAVLLLRRRGGKAPSGRQINVLTPPQPLALPNGLVDPASLPLSAEARREYIREQLANLADQHPALVASVLQSWVSEDTGGRP